LRHQTASPSITIKGKVSGLAKTTITVTADGLSYTPVVTAGAFEQQISFDKEKTCQVKVTANAEVLMKRPLSVTSSTKAVAINRDTATAQLCWLSTHPNSRER